MTQEPSRKEMADELKVAIGLVWGHLKARQYEKAYKLARGCLNVWPGDECLMMMAAYATVELNLPLDEDTLELFRRGELGAWKDWVALVLRRAESGKEAAGRKETLRASEKQAAPGGSGTAPMGIVGVWKHMLSKVGVRGGAHAA